MPGNESSRVALIIGRDRGGSSSYATDYNVIVDGGLTAW